MQVNAQRCAVRSNQLCEHLDLLSTGGCRGVLRLDKGTSGAGQPFRGKRSGIAAFVQLGPDLCQPSSLLGSSRGAVRDPAQQRGRGAGAAAARCVPGRVPGAAWLRLCVWTPVQRRCRGGGFVSSSSPRGELGAGVSPG